MGVQELDYSCPFCGSHTRGLEELVFTQDEDMIFYKGRPLKFRKNGRMLRQVFKYMFRRRNHLILHSDLWEKFLPESLDPSQYMHVIMRHLRVMIKMNNLPIEIKNSYKEGFILTVNARETL